MWKKNGGKAKMVAVGFSGGWTEARLNGLGRDAEKQEVLGKILSGRKIRTCRLDSPHWRKVKEGATLHQYWGLRQRDCTHIGDYTLLYKYPLVLTYEKVVDPYTHEDYMRPTIKLSNSKGMLSLQCGGADSFAYHDGFINLQHMMSFIQLDTIYTVLEWGTPK